MNDQTLVTITQGLNLVAAIGPVAVGIALQLKKLLSGADDGSSFDVQIQAYQNGILKTVEETDQIIKNWMDSHAV